VPTQMIDGSSREKCAAAPVALRGTALVASVGQGFQEPALSVDVIRDQVLHRLQVGQAKRSAVFYG
jgi:hypothetical protein